ncbi:hypothetical protein F3Y22_tig00005459pilonHSYRG00338 [Hibiscus syriacus]|uniref:Uncharacterized protein n=1 Tax=Hibiscus syriacus TaxID=106335 RepID=A0A6A3CFT9_HIBSY|nr:hypothetical protein F3Y22_tig00005459pilonHSYRG00338 [Hibiscus syriacus]
MGIRRSKVVDVYSFLLFEATGGSESAVIPIPPWLISTVNTTTTTVIMMMMMWNHVAAILYLILFPVLEILLAWKPNLRMLTVTLTSVSTTKTTMTWWSEWRFKFNCIRNTAGSGGAT